MIAAQQRMAERQIETQQQMRERMMAVQIAGARDLCRWFGAFYSFAAVGLLAGAIRTRKPQLIAPLVPLTFVLGYQYDMGWGFPGYPSKIERIVAEADDILQHQQKYLGFPGFPLSVASLDAAAVARANAVAAAAAGAGTSTAPATEPSRPKMQ